MQGCVLFLIPLLPLLISSWIRVVWACYSDGDCNIDSRCCRVRTGEYRCTSSYSCDNFCVSHDDCLDESERCDYSQEVCTNYCTFNSDCRTDYNCEFNSCVFQEDTSPTLSAGNVVIIVAFVMAALLFGCCCHFCSQKRRQDQLRANTAVVYERAATQSGRDTTQNVDDNTTPENNTQPTADEESQHRADPIVDSGPPPYSCLTVEPQSPPPTYEEALRVSSENLATTRQEVV